MFFNGRNILMTQVQWKEKKKKSKSYTTKFARHEQNDYKICNFSFIVCKRATAHTNIFTFSYKNLVHELHTYIALKSMHSTATTTTFERFEFELEIRNKYIQYAPWERQHACSGTWTFSSNNSTPNNISIHRKLKTNLKQNIHRKLV